MKNPQNIKGKGFDAHPENINRKGAPKKIPAIDELLSKLLGEDEAEKSEAEAVFDALIKKAKTGDVRAIEVLLDRMYGKVSQTLDHTNNGGSFNNLTDDELESRINQLLATRSKTGAG